MLYRSEILHNASSRSTRRNSGQAELVGSALGWVIAIIVLAGLVGLGYTRVKLLEANNAASRLSALVTAGNEYLNGFGPVAVASGLLTPGGPPIIIPMGRVSSTAPIPEGVALPPSVGGTLPSVQGAGYLPASYVDVDAFGQSHDLVINEPTNGHYQALILSTGGPSVPNSMLGAILQKFPEAGGEVVNQTPGISAGWASEIAGANRGWTIPLDEINQNGNNIAAPGHYAVLLSNGADPNALNNSQDMARYGTGTAANGMTTDINMNNNSDTYTGAVSLEGNAGTSAITSSKTGMTLSAPTVDATANQAVTGNNSAGSLAVSNTYSVGTMNAQSGQVSGSVSAGALSDGTNMSLGGNLTVGSTSSPYSTFSSGNLTTAGSLDVGGTAAVNSNADISGNVTVGGNMTDTGALASATHIAPTYQAQLGASCASPGEYSKGIYQDLAGRHRHAEMFCEPGANGNVWAGAVGASGYSAPLNTGPTTVNAVLTVNCLKPVPIQGRYIAEQCLIYPTFATQPTPGEYIKLNITGIGQPQGYPCVGCNLALASPFAIAEMGNPPTTVNFQGTYPNFFGPGQDLVVPTGSFSTEAQFYNGAVGVFGGVLSPAYTYYEPDPVNPSQMDPISEPAISFPPTAIASNAAGT